MDRLNLKAWTVPALMVVYLGYVAVLTLSPFEFSTFYWQMFFADRDPYRLLHVQPVDAVSNILFFVPWGMLLSRYLGPFRKRQLVPVALLGLALSFCIEFSQLFLDRATSVIDLITNSAGTMLGFFFVKHWWPRHPAAWKLLGLIHQMWLKRLVLVAYVGWLAFLLSFPVTRMDFNNWNDRFFLYLGNEGTGDRPWAGDIYGLAIYPHALSQNQIKELSTLSFHQDADEKRLEMGAVALYNIDEGRGDTLQPSDVAFRQPLVGKELHWVKTPESTAVRVARDCIATPESATELSHALQESKAFTVEMRFRAANLEQTGPARIVTLSNNTTRRNFMIGQSENDLYFRVRTPLNGNNGSWIQMQGADALPDTSVHHVVATFHRGVEKIFVDGKLNGRTLRIDLDYVPRVLRFGKLRMSQWTFLYAMIFPLTFLSVIVFRKHRVVLGGLLALGLLLFQDLLLHFWLGQAVEWRFWLPALVWLVFSSLVCSAIGLEEHDE